MRRLPKCYEDEIGEEALRLYHLGKADKIEEREAIKNEVKEK